MNDTSSLPHGDANLGLFDAGPDQRRPDQRRPEQRRPDQRRPEQRRPEQRRPEQRRPEQRRPEQLAAEPTPAGTPTPLASAPFTVTRGDAVDLLRGLPSSSVDLIVTDPAYESLEKHRAIGTTTRLKHSKSSSNDWFAIFPNARFPELFAEAYRVLSRNAHLYLFCDQETMFVAKPLAEQAGFRFWKPIVWDKVSIGMGYHYRSRYELILFLEKGKRKLNDLGVPDVLRFPRVHRGYPSEKPPEVSEVLIRQSSLSGELVIDPFCGSGSVGVAALRQGRRFLGGDVSATAVGVATTRLAEALATPAAAGATPAPAEAPRDEGPCS